MTLALKPASIKTGLLYALLLCLLHTPVAYAQTKPVLERKGELEFGDEKERILNHKFLGGENRLVLVGRKTVMVLDVLSARVVSSGTLELPDYREDKPRLISPDGRRIGTRRGGR